MVIFQRRLSPLITAIQLLQQADAIGRLNIGPTDCLETVLKVFPSLKFTGYKSSSTYDAMCHNPNEVLSIYATVSLHCALPNLAAFQDLLDSKCVLELQKPALPITTFAADLTPQAIGYIPVVNQLDRPSGNITTAVVVSQDWFNRAYLSFVSPRFCYPLIHSLMLQTQSTYQPTMTELLTFHCTRPNTDTRLVDATLIRKVRAICERDVSNATLGIPSIFSGEASSASD